MTVLDNIHTLVFKDACDINQERLAPEIFSISGKPHDPKIDYICEMYLDAHVHRVEITNNTSLATTKNIATIWLDELPVHLNWPET